MDLRFWKNNKEESMEKVEAEPSVTTKPMSPLDTKEAIIEQIKTIYDPEIPVNIYELGLIYEVNVKEEGKVHVLMTLTAPACPAAEFIPEEVKSKSLEVAGVEDVEVELTFDPPWEKDMMSEEAQLELGFL